MLGEYAVLEQAPCLVAAADRDCVVELEPADDEVFRLKASNPDIADVEFIVNDSNELVFTSRLSNDDKNRLRFVIAVLRKVINESRGKINPAIIKIDTRKFYHKSREKLGLGASAAITVALLAALQAYIGMPVSGIDLYEEAFPIHRQAQGKLGSGSDIAASAVGGIIQYQMPKDVTSGIGIIESLNWPENLHVIPVWAGKSASTQDLVQRVRAYREQEPETYSSVMNPMINLAEKGCNAFKAADLEALFEIITDYAVLERKLGEASKTDIVSDSHQQIAKVVQSAGGVYKPSGAGNGDMGVAFCNGMDSRMQVEAVLKNSPFDIVELSLQTGNLKAENISTAG